MRTVDEAVDQFVYRPATAASAVQHARVRDLFVAMVHSLWGQVPDGPEKTLALRKLQEAAMYANLAIALGAPADTSDTRSVARVLPDATPLGASLVSGPTPGGPPVLVNNACDAGTCDCAAPPVADVAYGHETSWSGDCS